MRSTGIVSMVLILVALALPAQAESGPYSADQPLVWLVELNVAPFALAHGQSGSPHEAARSVAGRAVLSDITQRQSVALAQISERLHRSARALHTYRFATVGFALSMTRDEAKALEELTVVRRVILDEHFAAPETDSPTVRTLRTGPATQRSQDSDPVVDLIGASEVWNGNATGDEGYLGEGVTVGVVGSGINADHPSFAGLAQDGYQHINPYGDGVYVGECFASADLTCNSKLIGRWSFVANVTSQDDDGYTTFVTGLAVGNRLSGENLSDLNASLISGVAPHANLIAYRVCAPTCAGTATIAAFDQAIADGVDVLLHIVGSPSTSPWEHVYAQIALTMRDAGISMAYTTGASGPAQGSMALSLAAPWVTSFTTTTHARDFAAKVLAEFTGGASALTVPIFGRSLSSTFSGAVVYAGDYPNPSAPGTDPAQCLQPYPPGTFDGQIVMCDRGEISRFLKSVNVASGGAGGFILGNLPDSLEFLGADQFAVPGIHVAAKDAATLREWLAQGSGHVASIQYSPDAVDAERADLISASSSRGPNLGLSYLAPTLAAPALNVLGPGLASELVLRSARGSAPGAGALALMQSARPQWTQAQIVSALVTTANPDLREEDQITSTGPYDHGGGRIDIAAAVNAGLLLDAQTPEFAAADPAQGGDPAALNLGGLVDLSCLNGCSWTRELQATRDDTWDAVAFIDAASIDATVTPATFSLQEGERQIITVTIAAGSEAVDADYFGAVNLQPQSGLAPVTRLPIAARVLADGDLDGVANAVDNCLNVANPNQRDTNGDGYGNVCDADLNNDCRVNVIDLGLLRASYFETGDLDADLDGDQYVGPADLGLMRSLFLSPPGPGAEGVCDARRQARTVR